MSAAEPQPSKPDAPEAPADAAFDPQEGLDQLRAELEQLAASIDEAGQQIVEITEEQSEEAVDQVEAERQIAELRQTMRQQQEELERRQQEIENRQAALAEREQQIQTEKSELQQQLEQRQQQIAERQQHVEQLQTELTEREKSLDGEKGQVDQRAAEIKAQQEKLAAEQAALERWQKQLERREKRSSYPTAGDEEHPSPYIEKTPPPPRTPEKPAGNWGRRLLIDAAIILAIAAVIVGYYLYSQHQIGLEHRIVAVQRAIGDIQAEAIYRGATGRVDHLPNGYPVRIETAWFDQLPVNSLVGSDVPWLQIVGREQRNLVNPPDIVATKHAAAFWYNPYRGLIRARVPAQYNAEATVKLYNRINNTRVDITQVVQPD